MVVYVTEVKERLELLCLVLVQKKSCQLSKTQLRLTALPHPPLYELPSFKPPPSTTIHPLL